MEFTGRGRFFGIVSRISDLIVLGCIFILTSLPIFTLGASCTALYYSVAKSIRFEEGKPVREYFKAWKNNFVQSSIATIIYLLLTGALVCTAVICSDGSMTIFIIFAGVILVSSFIYFFPVLSRFTVSLKACFQISIFFAVHYIAKTAMLLITLALCILVFFIVPVALPVLIPFFTFYATFFVERLFKDYMNLTDKDTGRWYARS